MNDRDTLRVLYIENGIGYGGAVICLRHLIRNINRAKFKPIVVTSRNGPQYQEISSEADWYHFPDSIFDVERIRRWIKRNPILSARPILKNVALQLLARFDDLGNFLPFFLWLIFLSLRIRPRLIHVNNEPFCNRAGILVGKILNIPIVCHVRGNPKGSWLTLLLYKLPDHFIPVSNWVSDGIQRLGVPLEKISVVYDGIALDNLELESEPLEFRKKFKISQNAFAVGLVGMLIPWKGQNLFLDAVKLLIPRMPDLTAMFIGGTPDDGKQYERELKQRAFREGLEKKVFFTGHISDMCSVYNGLDIVLSASTSPEPLGTMVIESMAMGRPLIVPNHGGGAEMNTPGETALVFKSGNAESLAETIIMLYRNPKLRKQLGKNARARALTTFDVQVHARRVEEVYRLVLGE